MEAFVPWPKIPRLSRNIVVTEKIDGTNASIHIDEITGEFRAASRTRYIQPENDNYGFARWAYEHKDELVALLGPGSHFGEWWGPGIQRGYGLKNKQFSLFNTHRWSGLPLQGGLVNCVPILYTGPFSEAAILGSLEELGQRGSAASPGFMRPEGIVIYHEAGKYLFKKTFEGDEGGKSE